MLDNKRTVITLGYFDSVHIGHRQIINKALKLAKDLDATLTVFSFNGDLKGKISQHSKYVYNPKERCEIFYKLGASEVFLAPLTKKYLSKGKLAFLNDLNAKLNICAYVVGSDYTFGKNATGTVDYLKRYAKAHNQEVFVEKLEQSNGEKISTSNIKKLLNAGKIEEANALLGEEYFVSSTVVYGRGVGRQLDFRTANVMIEENKVLLKEGVYMGKATVDGKTYKAVINYGRCPTFNQDKKLIETHILGINENLYGKKITVRFAKFIREIIKFSSIDMLKEQIEKDCELVKNNG